MKRNAISQWELSDHFWAESDPPEPCATAAGGFLRRCARRLDRLTADKRVKYRLHHNRADGGRRGTRSADRSGGCCCGGGGSGGTDSGNGRHGTADDATDCCDDALVATRVIERIENYAVATATVDTTEADPYREASTLMLITPLRLDDGTVNAYAYAGAVVYFDRSQGWFRGHR